MTRKEAILLARHLRKNQTPAEKYFWSRVRRKNLGGYRFQRQYVIAYAEIMGTKFFYIVDFYCHAKKLVVEIDGPIHKEQQAYDQRRNEDLRSMGFTILRFTNEEVLENWDLVERALWGYLE